VTARAIAVLIGLALAPLPGAAADKPVSAFAANVGKREKPDEPAPAVTLFVVPDGRQLLVTDVLVANRGQESGVLYLADSKKTLCAVALLQPTLMNNPTAFSTLENPHVSFTTGIPVGPGESLVATLDGGTHGVDVTITGRLIPGPHVGKAVVIPGTAAPGDAARDGDGADAATP